MRHVKQMTNEELNSKIMEVTEARQSVIGTDSIRWNELYRLSEELSHEAARRANGITLGAIASNFGIVI